MKRSVSLRTTTSSPCLRGGIPIHNEMTQETHRKKSGLSCFPVSTVPIQCELAKLVHGDVRSTAKLDFADQAGGGGGGGRGGGGGGPPKLVFGDQGPPPPPHPTIQAKGILQNLSWLLSIALASWYDSLVFSSTNFECFYKTLSYCIILLAT